MLHQVSGGYSSVTNKDRNTLAVKDELFCLVFFAPSEVILQNRKGCCQSRLRDIIVTLFEYKNVVWR